MWQTPEAGPGHENAPQPAVLPYNGVCVVGAHGAAHTWMNPNNTLTIVVPALNEEANLRRAVTDMVCAAQRHFDDHEILIFNDGSTDRTGQIADELAAEYDRIEAIHHQRPRNLGGVIQEGYSRARMSRAIWVDGKAATSQEALEAIFSLKDQAALVIPYSVNRSERAWGRRALSAVFRGIVNGMFGLRLQYHQHSVLCRTADVRQFTIHTTTYAWQAEALVKMIRAGIPYVEVPVRDRYDNDGRATKAFRPGNVLGVAGFLWRTFWDVYVTRNYRTRPPRE